MKKCNTCYEEKPLDQFAKGYAKCKICRYEIVKKYRQTEAGKAKRKEGFSS